jgi:hypothetical protein
MSLILYVVTRFSGSTRLFPAMDRMSAMNDPAILSPEAIAAEIAALRAERRAKNAS